MFNAQILDLIRRSLHVIAFCYKFIIREIIFIYIRSSRLCFYFSYPPLLQDCNIFVIGARLSWKAGTRDTKNSPVICCDKQNIVFHHHTNLQFFYINLSCLFILELSREGMISIMVSFFLFLVFWCSHLLIRESDNFSLFFSFHYHSACISFLAIFSFWKLNLSSFLKSKQKQNFVFLRNGFCFCFDLKRTLNYYDTYQYTTKKLIIIHNSFPTVVCNLQKAIILINVKL